MQTPETGVPAPVGGPDPRTAGVGSGTVTVVGGGVAGLSAACALTEAGFTACLAERRSYLGGRASSFLHPGVGEVVDNCQHVLFGCCTNLRGFYKRVGVSDRIRWTGEMTMIEPGGRRTSLGSSLLPAPFHGIPSFLIARAFTLRDKTALGRAFTAMLRGVPSDSTESLGSWLARNRQTKGALDRFWRLVIASALNSDVDSISLVYAAKVIRELFLNSPEAGRMGMSSVPLGELHQGAARFLVQRGSSVVYNARIESASWDGKATQWTLATASGELRSRYLVLALPFESLGRLLPGMPQVPGTGELAAQIGRHSAWPICSVHLWFDREITELEHAVLLDREIHWMYNKGALQPWRRMQGSYLELVVSASRPFAALSAEQAVSRAVAELADFFPEVRSARLVKSAFIKEVRATFGVPPGVDSARPGARSPWPNCFLAGDWTSTGWPSTMESAARSGHRAAEAICTDIGKPRPFVDPDLPPGALMRLLAR